MSIEDKNFPSNYGLLINDDIKLHRMWFKQMCSLIGIIVLYRAVIPGKKWTNYTEIDANYAPSEPVGCIFSEHPDQKTMKKLGWDAELQDGESIINVPYDLHDIQVGSLFIVPSGIDNSIGRLFRVTEISNIMIYPASLACKIVPQYENDFNEGLLDHSTNSFNLLEEEEMGNLR